MDAQFLHLYIDYLGIAGVILTSQQKSALQTSLVILQNEMQFSKVFFWGVIKTTGEKDYYIAEGIENDALTRRLLFSRDCFHWKLLINTNPSRREKALQFRAPLTGDLTHEASQAVYRNIPNPATPPEWYVKENGFSEEEAVPEKTKEEEDMYDIDGEGGEGEGAGEAEHPAGPILRSFLEADLDSENGSKLLEQEGGVGEEAPGEEEAEEEEEEEEEEEQEPYDDELTGKKTLVMTEEDRLAAMVAEINFDTALVPKGAYLLAPTGKVISNTLFCGLQIAEAGKMESYYHFRPAVKLFEKALLARADLDMSFEFMDPASEDLPRGCWCVQYERGGAVVIIKSLMWPEYVFCHVPGKQVFGSVYVGYGLKNWDLPFML